MNITPKEDFIKKYNNGENQIVWSNFSTDLHTPISTILKLRELDPHHILLESVVGGEQRGRYSIIALDPSLIWKCENYKAYISTDLENFVEEKEDPLSSFRTLLKKTKIEIPSSLPSMASGLFGFMGYDMVKIMEDLPDNNPVNIGIPQALYILPKTIVIFDSAKDNAFICNPVFFDKKTSAIDAYDKASQNIEKIYKTCSENITKDTTKNAKADNWKSHIPRSEYCKIVKKAKEHIVAGDIFQIVPSRRISGDFSGDPFAFYRNLRTSNPSPYLFYMNFNGFTLVGSSPEILVRVIDEKVTLRPIAGTRKRGKNQKEDLALETELLSDKKELAEHLMLLDLGRHDIGRVSKDETIKITDKMIIERYSHVMHIVSNIEGELREDKDNLDALIAGFPAGTVSGAPKIKAMKIIDDIESEKREFYGGTAGYFSSNGDMDTCIMLRTALVHNNKIYVQAGGGVVYDSEPEMEFQETENKAKAIFNSL